MISNVLYSNRRKPYSVFNDIIVRAGVTVTEPHILYFTVLAVS